MGRILGVDHGLVRIGLSLSDPLKILASPLKTLLAAKNKTGTIKLFLEAIAAHDIEAIVIGIPYLMNGKIGAQGDEVNNFIKQLKEECHIPIISWDERLTSVQADRCMRETSMTRKKRSENIDSVAAVIILQSYLDSKGASFTKNRMNDGTGNESVH